MMDTYVNEIMALIGKSMECIGAWEKRTYGPEFAEKESLIALFTEFEYKGKTYVIMVDVKS